MSLSGHHSTHTDQSSQQNTGQQPLKPAVKKQPLQDQSSQKQSFQDHLAPESSQKQSFQDHSLQNNSF